MTQPPNSWPCRPLQGVDPNVSFKLEVFLGLGWHLLLLLMNRTDPIPNPPAIPLNRASLAHGTVPMSVTIGIRVRQ